MRYKLRTLLIFLAVLPPVLARMWFTRGAIFAAVGRMSAEDRLSLTGLAVAFVVVIVEVTRRAKGFAAHGKSASELAG
jgi:hypothetical protein